MAEGERLGALMACGGGGRHGTWAWAWEPQRSRYLEMQWQGRWLVHDILEDLGKAASDAGEEVHRERAA